MNDISEIFDMTELDRLEQRARYYIQRARYGSATHDGQLELDAVADEARARLAEIAAQRRIIRGTR